MNQSSPAAARAPVIEFPAALPVSQRADEIARAMAAHQVVIVCGETGSGKTTQIPKIALKLGRGRLAGGRGLIGHTQPRRLAATTVAARIAEETQTALGELVGYKIRFADRLQRGASIKLMTDGILLAETQGDPLLKAYDTLIIDEAHERSLNIDFLLGYLRQILPRRPDLKLIVTSATIDAERFATHFADASGKPAPVIQVSGRLYPVEMRWRAPPERGEVDLNLQIADAVDELWRGLPRGDILVFLPGEREIREAADHLRKHLGHARGPAPEVLPLFARLSQAEQARVFHPGGAARVVLATNVAETSLTVPGIRYVVDAGTARVKRYSWRNKVEQLLIEPVSQAAANQRAGRCGRVADGICIRLYSEADYAGRSRFTDPEILRSSLAGVILRMKALGLGAVEAFPFLEAPPGKAIADGYALLGELGAVDEAGQLTDVGRQLARLPLDPRVARMLLAASERGSLAEVLVIASALSGQDVRDRPLEQQQAADEKHKIFDDERSEFVGYLKLWDWIEAGRGVHGHAPANVGAAAGASAGGDRGTKASGNAGVKAGGPFAQPAATDSHKLSNRQQEQRLRAQFVSPRRVREWRDIHSQLRTAVIEAGFHLNTAPASYEQIHLAMLAGLLGNIGCKVETSAGGAPQAKAGARGGDADAYLGARGIKFWRHPGAHLSKKPGRWVVAAELVETARLFGRGIAAIDPAWLPAIAGHVLKTQWLDPRWEKKAGEVVATERATLYGLVIYNDKRVSYARMDPAGARELFIREALVQGDWDTPLPFLAHNRRLVAQVEQLEHKSRRQDVLVDEELIYAYYDQHLPTDVVGGATLARWWREASRGNPKLLYLTQAELMRHDAAGITSAAFPPTVRLGGIDCRAEYLHEPGDARDGVTVTVPLFALNQVQEARCDWLVPGLLAAKVQALLKTLPGRPRSRVTPIAEFAARFCDEAEFADGDLTERLLDAVRQHTQVPVVRADFKQEQVPPHLQMNLRVVDEHGRQLGMGRQLAPLKAEFGVSARSAFQALAALKVRQAPLKVRQAPPPAASTAATVPATAPATAARKTSAASSPATAPSAAPAADAAQRHTAWTFGELPELMELRQGGHSLVGFPAVIDAADHVRIEVFDEPEVAAARHRLGLSRLFALQLKEPLKYLDKNLPGLVQMAGAYMQLGSAQQLKEEIIAVALERAFLQAPLPTDATQFAQRLEAGRSRLTLIAQEVARLAATILADYAAGQRKLKDARASKDVADDITAQLAQLVPARFLTATPYAQLAHFPRYLKAIAMRLDKLRADPARDAQRQAEHRALAQRWQRRMAELKGQRQPALDDFRWQLEELRVSLFAQELRTPQPVSVKRLEKVWEQIVR